MGTWICMGFPGGRVVQNMPANAGDVGNVGLIPVSGRPHREENGTQLSSQSNSHIHTGPLEKPWP